MKKERVSPCLQSVGSQEAFGEHNGGFEKSQLRVTFTLYDTRTQHSTCTKQQAVTRGTPAKNKFFLQSSLPIPPPLHILVKQGAIDVANDVGFPLSQIVAAVYLVNEAVLAE